MYNVPAYICCYRCIFLIYDKTGYECIFDEGKDNIKFLPINCPLKTFLKE